MSRSAAGDITELHDVAVGRARRLTDLSITDGLVFVAIFALLGMIQLPVVLCAAMGFVLTDMMRATLQPRIRAWRAHRYLARRPQPPDDAADRAVADAARALERHGDGPYSDNGACANGLTAIAAHLLAARGPGKAYRFALRPADLPAVSVLRVPLEPTAIGDLATHLAPPGAPAPGAAPSSADGRVAQRRTPWRARVGTGVLAGLWLIIAGYIVAYACATGLPRPSWPPEGVVLAVLGSTCIASPLLRLMRRRCEWYAVPGGVVVRTAGGFSLTWQPRLVRRAESVLCYWDGGGQIAVATTAGGAWRASASPKTAAAMIGAWLSPLPPPTRPLADLV